MIHYCPQCADLDQVVEAETHLCERCKDTYCAHFMKAVGPGICWVCGSEKRKPIKLLPPIEDGRNDPVPVS